MAGQHEQHEHATEQTSLVSSHRHHSHDHDHHDHDATSNHPKKKEDPVLQRLKLATLLCLTFMLVEVVGGIWAGSLAVLSDAAHLTADLASFAVAIIAAYLAARPSTEFHTYGLKRTESLAALFSMTTLAMISIGLALEACRRIHHMLHATDKDDDDDVDGKLMSMIATIGVLVNLALAAVLGSEGHVHMPGSGGGHDHDHDHGHQEEKGEGGGHDHSHGHHNDSNNNKEEDALHSNEVLPLADKDDIKPKKPKNVNLHAAYLHVIADLAQSIAVLIAGLIIWYNPEWKIVDPIATILFCVLVFYSTLGVIRSAVAVMLEEVPPSVSWQRVHSEIQATPGVLDVHDLHIWSISQGVNALSVHVHANIMENDDTLNSATTAVINSNRILAQIAEVSKRHGIRHATIQIQPTTTTMATAGKTTIEPCLTCSLSGQSNSCMSDQSNSCV